MQMSEADPAASAGQGMTYGVDIVLCIDATASMMPVIEDVKARALRLPDDLLNAMAAKGKHVDRLRLKVVVYRDIFVDAEAFKVLDFINLPEERSTFDSFMSGVVASGGGDEPESGLEALGIALNSDWSNDFTKQRHLVVIWTDASTHPIENGVGKVPPTFADLVPSSLDELTDLWEGGQKSRLSQKARRLVLFTPEAASWTDLNDGWPEVIHFPSQAAKGMAEFEYEEILDLLVQSV
jgi:hypothetical protein